MRSTIAKKSNEKWPRVACIIPTFNGRHHLEWSLPSILSTDYPRMEVILVDDKSSDSTVSFVRSKFPEVKVIENSQNLGFAGSCNRGISVTDADYVAFLNNDLIVTPSWLKEIVRPMESDRAVVACAPKIMALLDDGTKYTQSNTIYNVSSAQDVLGYAFSEGEGETDKGQYHQREVLSTCGICLIRTREMKKFGGFDEDFFFGIEDIDLCWRLRLAGYKILSVPSSVLYHRWGTSKTIQPYTSWYLEERNRIVAMIKNYSSISLLKYLIPYLFLKSGQLLLLTLLRSPLSYHIARAMTWNLINFPNSYRKRLHVRLLRKVPDKEVIKFMQQGSVEFKRLIGGKVRIFLSGFFG